MTLPTLTFWEWERLGTQALILLSLWRIGSAMGKLLQDGQRDRHAREEVITDLKNTAIKLADRTATILAESEARSDHAERKLEAAMKDKS